MGQEDRSYTPTAEAVLTRLDLYFGVRQTNRAMRLFAQVFDNDYDTAAIFLTVAEVCLQAAFHLAAADPAEVDIEQLYTDESSVGVTTLSVAELTGIPRETARRKLKFLTDNGYLAILPGSKQIYLPASTIRSERFLSVFTSFVKDVGQLVRTVTFYQRNPA